MNNNNYITNDTDFQSFVNSTLNHDNNRSPRQDAYDRQITTILANHKNQLKFTRLFAHYYMNRQATNDYTYSSQCCVCMDTNNYCIKICDCSTVKYCHKCFKEYAKTHILADPIKINSTINGWSEQKLNLAELVSCSICHKSHVLGLMENIIDNIPKPAPRSQEISEYLHSLDFFSETVPAQGDPKWYILFNRDGRVRYNLVPLERINEVAEDNNNNNNHTSAAIDNDNAEPKLRQAGLIHIFEIYKPSTTEHQQIKALLKKHENQSTENTKQALTKYNPIRLKLL